MTQPAIFRQFQFYLAALLVISLAAGAAIASQPQAHLLVRVAEMAAVFGVMAAVLLVFLRRRMVAPLGGMLHALADGSARIDAMTAQVAHDAQALAGATSRQAAAIEETAATVEEMASMTQSNADHARETDRLMGETRETVTHASRSMSSLFGSIQEITRRSAETSRIVKNIDEIAFQTNILALNAAVEAARAGEHGAGFAVVADEVRTLAQRAADAARETGELIENTNRHVAQAASLVDETRRRFTALDERVSRSGGFVSQIATASVEQARGLDQLNVAVTEIDRVVQQTVANAEHSADAAEQMSAQSHEMSAVIEQLRVLMNAREVARGEEDAAARVHLKIAVNTLIADSFNHWTAEVPVNQIRDFSSRYANRPTVDFVLQLQALFAGGLDFDYELRVVPNNERAKNEVVQGYADLSAETVWDAEIAASADGVIPTSPVILDGEFEKGVYVLPGNDAMLHVSSVENLHPFVGATVVSWATDMRALESMQLRAIERVFKEESLFTLLEQRRADFTLLEFASTGDMSITHGGVRLVPVPGCKVCLPGSRSWTISRSSPHAEVLAEALERGVQALRKEGRFELAYRQSGFFHPKVAHWKRVV